MAVVYLITGGSGSGKSEYAESIVMDIPCPRRYYVATMAVYGEESRAKVRRHHMLRRGKGFITVECQRDVGQAVSVPDPDGAVLLECISNLAANEMFRPGQDQSLPAPALAEKIAGDIHNLSSRVKHTVIVTGEVAWDGNLYDRETMEYIRLMGHLNRRLAGMAHRVVEVIYSVPVPWKMEERSGVAE